MAKFLLVLDCLGSGGAQRQLISIAKGLSAKGHKVELFIYFPHLDHFASHLENTNIKVHKVEKKGRFDLRVVNRLRQLIKQGEYNGAMAFMRTPSLYLELAIAMLPKKYRPIVGFSDRITFEKGFQPGILFKFRQQLHRVCDFITTNSHLHKDTLAEFFPWMAPKLTTVYNGVDQSILKTDEASLYSGKYLLAIARVIDYKNFERLAEAMVLCASKYGDVPTILWIGFVFDKEGVNRVNTLLEKAGLQDKLYFLGESKQIATYYQHADGLVHPSLIEGFSNVIAEAICCGLPLLLGNISDHERILEKYKNGMLFDVEDVNSIADVLHNFTQLSEQQKIQMGECSKKAAEELFVMDAAVDAYEQLLMGRPIQAELS